MSLDQTPLFCDRCSAILAPGRGEFYVVRIESIADPSPPVLDDRDVDDLGNQLTALFDQLRNLSEQEAIDQVFRRVILHLCNACHGKWIEDPTGAG